MSIVNFTSGINKIEEKKSLSEWAVEYISQEKLTRENHRHRESFRNLQRRRKDAIRYQLKKGSSANDPSIYKNLNTQSSIQKVKPNEKLLPVLRIGLSIWISCFLLIDIVQIYSGKGLSTGFAWQAALLVEICILVSSLCHEAKIRRIAYAFFLYNSALFGFSEISHIHELRTKNMLNSNQLDEIYERKRELTASLSNMNKFREKSLLEMSKLVGKGYVSSVSNAVSKINSGLSVSEKNNYLELRNLEAKALEHETKITNIFTSSIISFLYFFLRCSLQLFSIWLLKPEVVTMQKEKALIF